MLDEVFQRGTTPWNMVKKTSHMQGISVRTQHRSAMVYMGSMAMVCYGHPSHSGKPYNAI